MEFNSVLLSPLINPFIRKIIQNHHSPITIDFFVGFTSLLHLLLSTSDVRGQGLFFSPLHGQSAVENFWSRDNIFCGSVVLKIPTDTDWRWSFVLPTAEKRKKPKEKFPPSSHFLGQGFSWVTRKASAGFNRCQHRFAFSSLGIATQNSVTRPVFLETAEPQKMLSRDQNFLTADWNQRFVKWAEKKPLSTDVWDRY